MQLSDRERDEIKRLIDAGQSLPPQYGLPLSADVPAVELAWQDKSSAVTPVAIRFQFIEQIDDLRLESREQQLGSVSIKANGRQASGWSSKLIWGDDKLVLLLLKNSSLCSEIMHLVENNPEHEAWPDSYVLKNKWKRFRTHKARALELTSASHENTQKWCYKVAVKATVILGKDMPKALGVEL